MRSLLADKILLFIILTAFLLRIIGLTPNFQQHPDEPIVISPSGKIAMNVIKHFNPDPNVDVPFPFQYATAVIYIHAIIEAFVLSAGYLIHNLTGQTFELSENAYGNPNFEKFFTDIGPIAMANALLWFHRLPSVLFGTVTVLLVYKTVLFLLKNRVIALFSALALAFMPHHVRDSHYATVNIIQAFFFLLSFYLSAKIWKANSFRNCALAGICTGFAISIKYFPLPLVPLLLFLFLARKRLKPSHLLIIVFSIVSGYLLGMPYVFIYFDKMVEFYKFTVNYYSPAKAAAQPFLERILPPYFHSFHLKFFFENGVGQILSIVGVVGIIQGLKRWPVVTISLFILPFVNLLFITFYLEAIYETLIIPALPFFAIFIGIACWWFISHLSKPFFAKVVAALVLTIIFFPPLVNSAQASLACTKTITEWEAHDWIAKNIPEGAVVAYQPNMRLPSKNLEFIRLDPQGQFLLAEIQETKARYIALHSGYTDRYKLWLEDNILLPTYVRDNEFTNLAFEDFVRNANLLHEFVRPVMCVNSRIDIFNVPEILSPVENEIRVFNFKEESDLSFWKLGQDHSPSGTSVEVKNNLVEYKFDPLVLIQQLMPGALKPAFYGTPLRSPFLEIKPNEKYTGTVTVKRLTSPGKIPDGFIRLDFYNGDKKPISLRLSSRLKQENGWQTLVITAIAPENAHFMTVSFQTLVAGENSDYAIKEAIIKGR